MKLRAQCEASTQIAEHKAKTAVGPPAPVTKKQIRDIVKAINSGKLKLPDLDLDNINDKDVVTMWASIIPWAFITASLSVNSR